MRTPAFPPRKIVVAVDDSPPSWAALSAAKSLAALLGSGLEAVYVEPIAPLPEFEPALAVSEGLQRDLIARLRARLAGELPLRVIKGMPVGELTRLARPRTAQLLVVGTHGREGADRFLLGSVAEAVMHRAHVPVLAVRERQPFDPARVLVPFNLERYAAAALRYAFSLAARMKAGVSALYVAPPLSWDVDADAKLRGGLEAALGKEAAASVERIVRVGEAREEIAREAGSGQYGLLALSAHHRAQLSDLALGTTAERLMRRCAIPLLAVPEPAPPPRASPRPPEALAWK